MLVLIKLSLKELSFNNNFQLNLSEPNNIEAKLKNAIMLKIMIKESGEDKEKIIVMEKVSVKAEAEAPHKEELKMVNIKEIKEIVIINNGIKVKVNTIMVKLLIIEPEVIVQLRTEKLGEEIKIMKVMEKEVIVQLKTEKHV